MTNKGMNMRNDARMLANAFNESLKANGAFLVKTVVRARDTDEMKDLLQEFGYKYIVNKKAYKNINEISASSAAGLPIRTRGGYLEAVVEEVRRR